MPNKKLSNDDVQEIIKLLQTGMSVKQIMPLYKCGPETIYNRLRKVGFSIKGEKRSTEYAIRKLELRIGNIGPMQLTRDEIFALASMQPEAQTLAEALVLEYRRLSKERTDAARADVEAAAEETGPRPEL